jgi:predicted dehydrogenase/threonine dehydrogenase-like Zn-dependent dehydrogenase
MKQVAQRPRDGRVSVEHVPTPALRTGSVLISVRFSLISTGTERSKIDLGRKNLVAKARARPDLVRKTLDKARSEGIASTVAVVRDRLAGLSPLGYSIAGVVEAIGTGVEGVSPGDRVAGAGAGWANHASTSAVPKNLVARVPEGVDLADAAYATVGAIAMHGVRQSDARLGERIGVIGLGLVGQLAVRILIAAGCEVWGTDLDPQAISLAGQAGARTYPLWADGNDSAVASSIAQAALDGVIICAASSSSGPVDLACRLLRPGGRIVVVGDVPISADRTLMYEKELELRLSRSYGPGRYSTEYEEHGHDLPAEYVRWTEQRNLQAFLDLIAADRLSPSQLTTHRFPIDQAGEAYAVVESNDPRPFGVLLEYPEDEPPVDHGIKPKKPRRRTVAHGGRIGVLGAGAFARSVLLPGLTKAGATLAAIASEGGLTAADAAARFGFERAATTDEILADDRIDGVVITTTHSSHATLTAAALRAGKAVFVEKPLALTNAELSEVAGALPQGRFMMVGFNRRFAPFVSDATDLLQSSSHRSMTIRVNAGRLPVDHWLHDPLVGGGRLLGEGCHFIDLLMHCMRTRLEVVNAFAQPTTGRPLECGDNFTVSLRFADGSLGTLLYTAEGDARMGKERIEAFAAGQSLVIDDFRRLERYRDGRRSEVKRRQNKGHQHELERFLAACLGRAEPPDPSTYFESTQATFAAVESLLNGRPLVTA